ncbi:MAG: ssDNA-binding protein, mitochondrial [Cyphobasidiales sp. Tagirdzhanova-0007]|nr:MAG: ssDNA-binding protein, mitochondrial [Cyphobasidiales sp. Tagirdzhanova-0007]
MLARTAFCIAAPSRRSFATSCSASLARMTLIGRLGASPQPTKDKQGRDILIYSVATNDRTVPAGPDGTRPEQTTSWHRVLSYNSAGRDYLSALPSGTLLHIEADFKKRTTKDESGNYAEQTLLLMRNVEVLGKPKDKTAEGDAETTI